MKKLWCQIVEESFFFAKKIMDRKLFVKLLKMLYKHKKETFSLIFVRGKIKVILRYMQ